MSRLYRIILYQSAFSGDFKQINVRLNQKYNNIDHVERLGVNHVCLCEQVTGALYKPTSWSCGESVWIEIGQSWIRAQLELH